MNMNNKNPFKTPEGYFDSFQYKLMDKLSKGTTVIPKDTVFKVPNNYFDTFNDRLTTRLKKEPKVVQLYPVKKIIAIVAAVAAVVIVYLGLNLNSAESVSFTGLANTDIEAYFENNELGLSSYEIAEVIPVSNNEVSDMVNSPISEENILEYLNENINDFEAFNLQDNE